jgi:hypothetical protein
MAVIPGGSTPDAFGRLMHQLGRRAPKQLAEIRRTGKLIRAAAGKPSFKRGR